MDYLSLTATCMYSICLVCRIAYEFCFNLLQLGYTPLIMACDQGHLKIVQILIRGGATLNFSDNVI